ncbi:MAG: UvrD-helicase domain-containing protein [Sulfurimonas sp.]|nr:UvrD-helicase domain-containing protein [Sulfurimonas sp.]
MNDINLSEKQKEIVEHNNSPICVEASAGSGKTRVLTQRIKFLLNQTKKKVLALTFTNKAGEEIRERLEKDIDVDKRLFVGTFHGFCQYVLENHGSSIGFSKMPHIFEDDKDRLELISQAIEQVPTYYSVYKEKTIKDKNNFKYRALNFISKVKRELILHSQYHEHTKDDNIILLYRSYQELLRT